MLGGVVGGWSDISAVFHARAEGARGAEVRFGRTFLPFLHKIVDFINMFLPHSLDDSFEVVDLISFGLNNYIFILYFFPQDINATG